MTKDNKSAYFEAYKVMSSAQITKFWECIDNAMRDTCPKTKSILTNCPNCGAVIDIQVDRCAYCDTPYTFVKPGAEANTIKLYADDLVLCEIQTNMNQSLVDSMKIQRGLV